MSGRGGEKKESSPEEGGGVPRAVTKWDASHDGWLNKTIDRFPAGKKGCDAWEYLKGCNRGGEFFLTKRASGGINGHTLPCVIGNYEKKGN